jgi:hypothetical protein
MKSFRQYIKEDGPSNGTGLFTYGLGFQTDMIPDDFDVEDYGDLDNSNDIDKKGAQKIPWEVENALYAERRREMVAKWLKAAGANAKESVGDQSLPQVPDWQTAKR